MRMFSLLGVAARAEGIRLTRTARGAGLRAGFGAAALICGFSALGMLHLAVWFGLQPLLGPAGVAGLMALFDLALGAVFLWFALRDAQDQQAMEAQRLRDAAFANAFTSTSIIGGALELLLAKHTGAPLAEWAGNFAEGLLAKKTAPKPAAAPATTAAESAAAAPGP